MNHPSSNSRLTPVATRRVDRRDRLAELYAQSGRKKDCLAMLQRLEKEDDAFRAEK